MQCYLFANYLIKRLFNFKQTFNFVVKFQIWSIAKNKYR